MLLPTQVGSNSFYKEIINSMNNKKTFTVLFVFMIFSFCFSQKKYGKIKYALNTKNSKIINGGGTLYFDEGSSLYILESIKKENTKVQKQGDGTTIHPSNTIDSLANKTKFIFFDKQKGIFYNNIINNNIEVIIRDATQVNWEITNEKKTILGYKCIKAIGNLYDNNYVVWYTEKIDYPFGPIKVNSLNGMILEAYNETLDMRITAEDIFLDTENTTNYISSFIGGYDLSNTKTREQYNDFLIKQLKKLEEKINSNTHEAYNKKTFKDLNCTDCND